MRRDLYQNLLSWKTSMRRKPLLIQGARQTGKTFLMKQFGEQEYENIFYFNFEETPLLNSFFQDDLEPSRILKYLSIHSKKTIQPEKDLLVFDEIQTSNSALNSLKYFQEKANNYHVMAAGSLLGIKLSSPKSFPVGKVNFLRLYPLTFFEFLDALQENEYLSLLKEKTDFSPLPEVFHFHLLERLKEYYYTGGMPEAVLAFSEIGERSTVREIQKEIVDSYLLDFAKNAPSFEIPKLSLIWDSIPLHLARENKKFVFSVVKKSARSRDYENALQWLDDAGLILRSMAIETARRPLRRYSNRSVFKVFALDVGILGNQAGIPAKKVLLGDEIFGEFRGAFTENYVAQQLVPFLGKDIFYWTRRGQLAEVDFLCEIDGEIFPLEVKSGINTKSKSLQSFGKQFQSEVLLRTTAQNFRRDKNILNIPLYAISLLERMITFL